MRGMMRDVLIALAPASMAGIYFFGWRAAVLMAVCIGVAVGSEWACRKLMRRENTIGDLSAVVTGLLLALNLPPGLPFWQAILGTVVAIVIAKQIFGGLGYNPFNPALIGRAFLLVSFAATMTTWSESDWMKESLEKETMDAMSQADIDALATATPLGMSQETFKALAMEPADVLATMGHDADAWKTGHGETDATASASPHEHSEAPTSIEMSLVSTLMWEWTPKLKWRLFIGDVNGCIGETSALALLLGGLFLLFRRVITWHVPVAYIGTVAVFAFVMQLAMPSLSLPVSVHLLAGGLMLGALFMATDPVTSPVTRCGLLIFGVGCGLLTMVIRIVPGGAYPEGVSFAILIMNALTPLINKACKPKKFGASK